ncbi:DNA mismatch repair protein spellchecker 1 [Contarinia nasturtii]|uniref:DNA mismatch repair protein spellchecker 1 n=1 Tax=Contarinia nasturtii TaxID=265458 RepID=UPI0012D3FF30|nr:DNA mismatch repair protein spellchecker 1 [Contarinia nasturtii]
MSNVKGTDVKPSQALNLDANQQKKFIRFYKSLGDKPASTVRFFDRNDYYSLHGEDAYLAAKEVFKSTANVKTMAPDGATQLDYICLNKGNFEVLLRELLLVKNYRVEVFTKEQTGEFSIEFKGSPGNLIQFESMLFNNVDMVVGSSILSVNMKQNGPQKTIGVACVEQNEQTFSVIEFDDNDFYSELEATIVLLGPKEAILPSIDGEYERINQLLERNSVMVTVRKKSEFTHEKSNLEQDLNTLLQFKDGQQANANSLKELKLTVAMASLNAAIQYLDLVSDACNHGHYKMNMMNLNRYVHLDAAAVSALNLLPKPGTAVNSQAYKWQSILGVLDRCQTPQGHRLMAQWVKQPLQSKELIKDRHDIVECFIDASTARADLYEDYMKRMPDVLMLSKKLLRKRATLQDIYRLYQVVIRTPKIVEVLKDLDCKTIDKSLCEPIKDTLDELGNYKSMVEQIIDRDEVEKGEFMVRPSFDEELGELKKTMDEFESKIAKVRSKAVDDLNNDSVKLEYVSHLGYHFRLTLKEESALRNNKKYRTIDTLKGGIRFTNDALEKLNKDFMEARVQYETQQQSIVEEVIKTALSYLGSFTRLNNHIAELDCLLSFAIAAVSAPIPYVKPKMSDESPRILNLQGMRHPCLELQEDITFIANDVAFKEDETNMYIITGPNMGGKSTYIRSVGAAVLMAHIGSFVACEEAQIPYVDSILGRIGADDNISKGLSTFMVEMIETAGIVRTATSKSLVVIDELGRGTSTYEGCGIAWSIAEHLAKETKCFTLFATHFHEITDLANTLSTVKNSHMVAISDKDTFTLLYQVRAGVMDKSFGIHVAKLANFPDEVVDLAQKIYDESEDHYSQLKSQDDEDAAKIFLEAIEKLTAIDPELVDDSKINELAKNINIKVKNSNNTYFREQFPQLFH